jgi:hypothetical protein
MPTDSSQLVADPLRRRDFAAELLLGRLGNVALRFLAMLDEAVDPLAHRIARGHEVAHRLRRARESVGALDHVVVGRAQNAAGLRLRRRFRRELHPQRPGHLLARQVGVESTVDHIHRVLIAQAGKVGVFLAQVGKRRHQRPFFMAMGVEPGCGFPPK